MTEQAPMRPNGQSSLQKKRSPKQKGPALCPWPNDLTFMSFHSLIVEQRHYKSSVLLIKQLREIMRMRAKEVQET